MLRHQNILRNLNLLCYRFHLHLHKNPSKPNSVVAESWGSAEGWLRASSVSAVAERSEGKDKKKKKERQRTVRRRARVSGKGEVRKLRSEECERRVYLSHCSAGTVCAAWVQFNIWQRQTSYMFPPLLCGLAAELWWKSQGAVWRLKMPFDRREIRYNGHVIIPPPHRLPCFYTRCGVSDPNLLSAKRKPKRRSEGERMFKALMLEN